MLSDQFEAKQPNNKDSRERNLARREECLAQPQCYCIIRKARSMEEMFKIESIMRCNEILCQEQVDCETFTIATKFYGKGDTVTGAECDDSVYLLPLVLALPNAISLVRTDMQL